MRAIIIPLLLLALCAAPAHAAFKSSSDAINWDQVWNPQPLADDIVLPMPCGLSLALRAIAIPQGALIRDKTFAMGISNAQNQDRQIYERQFPGHIAAPFTDKDIPRTWRKKLGQKNSAQDSWYFIGKYEISTMQWDAVMNALDSDGKENPAVCPRIENATANLPKTGVSWFEVQEFLNKYNAWLVKNHVSDLPAFRGTQNIAFLRLPTEEEWEYAARGGANVPPEWWASKDIFPLEDGKSLKDYAVTSQETPLRAPLGIGSRQANPLGLHDTAGNAREMVDGFFRLSIPDMSNGQIIRRLHGAAGGVLTKGGSFRSYQDGVLPGRRDEIPLYTAQGPSRPADLGFRVALSGLNIPSAQRLNELRNEAHYQLPQKTDAHGAQHMDPGATPLDATKALAARAEGALKEDLSKLQERLEEQQQAQEAENQKTLEQSFRSLLYQAETLRAFAFRYSATSQQLAKIRSLLKQQLNNKDRANAREILANGEKDLKDYLQSLQMGANYYKTTLEHVALKSQADIERLTAQTRREYGSNTIFDVHMRQNLDTLTSYIAIMRKKGAHALGSNAILKGILPEKHYQLLPF